MQSLTIGLADAGADAFWGWDDTASTYENLTAAEALAIIGGAANDFDGSGDVTITEADISDLAHTATAITDDLIVEADLNVDEAPADNDILTYDTTGANFSWQTPSELITAGTNISWATTTLNVDDAFLANNGDVGTGTFDFGGAVFEIPNSATLTDPAAAGQIGIDTTTDQLNYYGTANRIIPYFYEKGFVLEDPAAADDDVPFWHPHDNITITDCYCETQGGTSVEVIISDGTNALETITCDADGQADDGSIANGTFTANERMEFDIGTVTGSVDWVAFTITYTIDAD